MDLDAKIERQIEKIKSQHGYTTDNDFWNDFPDFKTADLAIEKMLSYGLIERNNKDTYKYSLTEKGWRFTTFKKYHKTIKGDWTKRNPLLFEIIKWAVIGTLGYFTRVATEPKGIQSKSKADSATTADTLKK